MGYRLGRYLDKIVPQLLESIDNEAAEADEQATNDLRENCFQVDDFLLLQAQHYGLSIPKPIVCCVRMCRRWSRLCCVAQWR